ERVLLWKRTCFREGVTDEDDVRLVDARRIPEPVLIRVVVNVPASRHDTPTPIDSGLPDVSEVLVGQVISVAHAQPHVAPPWSTPDLAHREDIAEVADHHGGQRGTQRDCYAVERTPCTRVARRPGADRAYKGDHEQRNTEVEVMNLIVAPTIDALWSKEWCDADVGARQPGNDDGSRLLPRPRAVPPNVPRILHAFGSLRKLRQRSCTTLASGPVRRGRRVPVPWDDELLRRELRQHGFQSRQCKDAASRQRANTFGDDVVVGPLACLLPHHDHELRAGTPAQVFHCHESPLVAPPQSLEGSVAVRTRFIRDRLHSPSEPHPE